MIEQSKSKSVKELMILWTKEAFSSYEFAHPACLLKLNYTATESGWELPGIMIGDR